MDEENPKEKYDEFMELLGRGDIPTAEEWKIFVDYQKLGTPKEVDVGVSLTNYHKDRRQILTNFQATGNNDEDDEAIDRLLWTEKDKLIHAINELKTALENTKSENEDDVLNDLETLGDKVAEDKPKAPVDYTVMIKDNNKLAGKVVAGMSKFDMNTSPVSSANWLLSRGIRTVITIEYKGCRRTRDAVLQAGIKWYTCFIPDWFAPCLDHLKEYTQLVEERLEEGGVATHCWGGTGRTPCFLASYLLHSKGVYDAEDAKPNDKVDNAQKAFLQVRKDYHKESIEMKAQYNALARYSDYLGNDPSILYSNDLDFNHGGGKWHKEHGDDGIGQDPGHSGKNEQAKNLPDFNRQAIWKLGKYVYEEDKKFIGRESNNNGRNIFRNNNNEYLIKEHKAIEKEIKELKAIEKEKNKKRPAVGQSLKLDEKYDATKHYWH